MILEWFDARQASEAGAALADRVTPWTARFQKLTGSVQREGVLRDLLAKVDSELRVLQLNFFKRARLANTFKWKLIENGVDKDLADGLTHSLVMYLSTGPAARPPVSQSTAKTSELDQADLAMHLLARGNRHFAQGEYGPALECYRHLLELDPLQTDALNNAGAALLKLGSYVEAEKYFRRALSVNPSFAEAHNHLGCVLRLRGRLADSESHLREAIKLKPNLIDAHCNLGLTLVPKGWLHDARGRFRKVLKARPRHTLALYGLGEIASLEGHWEEAAKYFDRALKVDPRMSAALAAQAGLRKMTRSDGGWLQAAEALVSSSIEPSGEAELRFAIGKYFDDVGEYDKAFHSYKRANEILRQGAEPYDRKGRSRVVRDLTRAYTREAVIEAAKGASSSMTPVFVVGMMRSGTSLVEQIIGSHPSAKGAGEVEFWGDVMRENEADVRKGVLDLSLRRKLAEAYLHTLKERTGDALRIVDKATVNSDYLGVIHSVFPQARIIYMRRDPIDTCLSCYFQNFSLALNFTFDLSDLAHYYKEHQRLIAHWRTVLPAGAILDVPYSQLVADQESWTRKIIEFLGLEWDERCLRFDSTQRAVTTASYWQVRQKIYKTSIARWRNYERYVGPLMHLRESEPPVAP